MRMRALAAVVAVTAEILSGTACMPSLDGVTFACSTDEDCPSRMKCSAQAGQCIERDPAETLDPGDVRDNTWPSADSADPSTGEGGVDPGGLKTDSILDLAGLEMPDIPAESILCRPCRSDADCAPPSGTGSCVDYGPVGSRCGTACGPGDPCPAGFDCIEPPAGGGAAMRCRMSSLACPCTDAYKLLPMACSIENEVGKCGGTRTCDSTCDAAVPAPEACNGRDDDCDGLTDEDADDCTQWFRDEDGDGSGVTGDSRCLCEPAAPYTASSGGDCDDHASGVHPGAPELCDGLDNDCNGQTDEGLGPADSTCAILGVCSGKVKATCTGGKWACDYSEVAGFQAGTETACDGLDNDCDGQTDEDFTYPDLDGPRLKGSPCGTGVCAGGIVSCRTDGTGVECPTDKNRSDEVCNQKDDDCDGVTDGFGLKDCVEYYADADQDGFGDAASHECVCFPAWPYTSKVPGDCDDANPDANPARKEDCATPFDDDCDGLTDLEGASGCSKWYFDGDKDGWGTAEARCRCGPQGDFEAVEPGDCDDLDPAIHPGGGFCGKDGDCDGEPLDAGEACDDANVLDWDGCNACELAEFRIDAAVTGVRGSPQVAARGGGNFILVWEDDNLDKSGFGVAGRLLGPLGPPDDAGFQVNQYTPGDQKEPAMAGAPGHGFVVAWRSNGQDGAAGGVFARRFTASGTPEGQEFRVNTWTTNTQSAPAIAMAQDGSFLVAWQSLGQDASDWGVFGQRFGPEGVASSAEFAVNAWTTGEQSDPAIAAFTDGRFVVAWASRGQDGSGLGVYGRRYQTDGKPDGAEFRVNADTTDDQHEPAVATFGDGRFAVAWTGPQGAVSGVWFRSFKADGNPDGLDHPVGAAVAGARHAPSIVALDEAFLGLTWSADGMDGSGYGILFRRFNASGSPSGPEAILNRLAAGSQDQPRLAAGTGKNVVVWTGPEASGTVSGVWGRRLDEAGVPRY